LQVANCMQISSGHAKPVHQSIYFYTLRIVCVFVFLLVYPDVFSLWYAVILVSWYSISQRPRVSTWRHLFPIYMLGSAQTSIAAEFDGQLCQFAGICAELWKELPERAKTEMLHESSKSRALVKVLWRAGPFDISLYPRCIIFLKRRAKQQSSSLYLYMMQAVKQTPTRLYFKPPPLSIKPHYIMTRARAPRRWYCSLGLFNFLSDNECNPIFPIKKKLLSFFSISEILFRTLNEQPPFRVFLWQGNCKNSWNTASLSLFTWYSTSSLQYLHLHKFW